MELIKIENIEYSIERERPILKEINTSIESGNMVALVGANGSGKSTLMKCINKIYLYSKGKIQIGNQNIDKMSHSEVAKWVSYVPQHEIKVSEIKVFDMVLSGRMPYITWKPSEKDYQKVSEVMNSLQISHLALKDFGELSGGQQQMVYIARAIAQETPIILLDEPMNNLDVKHQIEIMNLLKTLSEEGKTIIITLHDINLALKYCNQFIFLKSGKIFAQGGKNIVNIESLEQLYGVKMRVIQDKDEFFIIPY